jgi:hypothetical protein
VVPSPGGEEFHRHFNAVNYRVQRVRWSRASFYGINCSYPCEFMPAIQPGKWFGKVRCLRPNAAMMTRSLCTPVRGRRPGDAR